MNNVTIDLNELYESAFLLDDKERLDAFMKGFELAKQRGDSSHESQFGAWIAFMYINMGNIDEALVLANEAVALDRKNNNLAHLPQALVVLASVYVVLGGWSESEKYLNEASSVARGQDNFEHVSNIHWSLGWLYFEKEDYVKAKEHQAVVYEASVKEGDQDGQIDQWHIWTLIELGELGKASDLIEYLHKVAVKTGDKGYMANVYTLKGILSRAQKKWEEAIEYFEKSLKQHEAMNASRWNAYWLAKMVFCEYARVYLERNQEGDREKAQGLLDQALEILQKMGAKKDIEKIMAKKKLLIT